MESLLERKEATFNPLVLPLAAIALLGVFTHTVQLESAAHLSLNDDPASTTHIAEKVTRPAQDAQIELSSFTIDTSFLRSQQPPATRTREDDEKDYTNDRSDDDPGGSSQDLKNNPN
jgi:hypothetical protein